MFSIFSYFFSIDYLVFCCEKAFGYFLISINTINIRIAFIIIRKEYKDKITEQEIIDWTKENMAAYKYPRIVEFVRSLPKRPVGKILRRNLREKEEKKQKKK
ncbi:MAG: AMP-binding enzyme [Promethearchaeota archaeon]